MKNQKHRPLLRMVIAVVLSIVAIIGFLICGIVCYWLTKERIFFLGIPGAIVVLSVVIFFVAVVGIIVRKSKSCAKIAVFIALGSVCYFAFRAFILFVASMLLNLFKIALM